MLDRIHPVALAALGLFALAAMDSLIKGLSQHLSVFAIAFWRYAFGLIVAGGIYWSAGRPKILPEMWAPHGVRGLFAAAAALLFFYAVSVLPLAEAVTLGFIAPLLIPFVAWIVLKERVRLESVISGIVGFAGAALAASAEPAAIAAANPQRLWGLAAIIGSAVAYAITIVLLRARAGKDGAPIVGLMQALVPTALLAGPAFALAPPPPLSFAPLLALTGALGTAAWFLLIKAYARAEAQRLAPLEFTTLLWASLFGFAFFDETPRLQTFAGAALIIAAVAGGEWAIRRAARL